MDFNELINKRYSCRNFAKRPLEQEKLLTIIDQARLAPSAVNGQPWFVHAVSQAETMKKVITACTGLGMNRFIHQAQAFFVVTETRDKLISTTISKIKKLDFQTIDIGIFIAYLSLAATSQGLGSCILGWFNEKQLQEALNLPKSEKVRIVIALGYPESDEVKPKKRKSLNQISKFH